MDWAYHPFALAECPIAGRAHLVSECGLFNPLAIKPRPPVVPVALEPATVLIDHNLRRFVIGRDGLKDIKGEIRVRAPARDYARVAETDSEPTCSLATAAPPWMWSWSVVRPFSEMEVTDQWVGSKWETKILDRGRGRR
jgi:hypothetical protein